MKAWLDGFRDGFQTSAFVSNIAWTREQQQYDRGMRVGRKLRQLR